MIQSFRDKATEQLYRSRTSRYWTDVRSVALRKLDQLQEVTALQELQVPPGNHLEALSDDREGQHSIRINDQWRVCFVWTEEGPAQVEIVDYH